MDLFVSLALALFCEPAAPCAAPEARASLTEGLALTLDDHTLDAPPIEPELASIVPVALAAPTLDPGEAPVMRAAPPRRFAITPLVSLGASANVVTSGGVDGVPSYGIDALAARLVRATTHAAPPDELGEPSAGRVRTSIVEYRTAPSMVGCFVPWDAAPTCGATRIEVAERLAPAGE